MAVSYKKKYTNEAELVYDIAQSSNLFNVDTYNELLSTGKGEDYTYAIAGTLDKAVDSFNLDYYNLLNSDDKYTYILNEYYVDRNETAVDDSTGETYNIYDRNNEYIQAKIDEAIDLQTYNSLDGFTKTLATIGGFIGNAMNELFLGTIEGIVDLGAVIVGQADWAAQDFTGVAANREALQRFNRAYTFIDKNSVVSTMNDVFTGLVQMAPLAIPGAGQAIYFGAMAGNSASEAVRANPDIDYLTLLGYTAGVTLVEYGTEKISNVFFGGSAIDKLVFKTSSSKACSWITRMGLDFLSEGLEESISEFADSVLYTAMIDPNAPLASIQDILYAGLVGGLTGAVAAGGQIATTRKQTILADGTIVDSKTAKTLGYEGKSLSKTQSLNLMEQISKAKNILDTDAVADLQAKYSKESLEEIKINHSEEYNKAVESNENKQTLLTESVLGLNKIYETLGAEGFQKVTDIANYTIEQQRTLLSNYVDAAEGRTSKYKEVESKYRAINPNSSFTVSEDLSATELRLRDGIKKATGIDVYFGTLGERDGVKRQNGITLDEKTIVLDKSLSSTMSLDSILNQVVKEELVHTLQYQSGILDINTINDLMEEYNKLGGQQTEAMRTEEAYRNKSDLTKISEAQAKSLAQVLLFDKISVSRIFVTNNSTFNKVYKWMNKLKTTIETLKEFRTPKGKIKYRTLLQTMDMYRSVVAESIGNDEDANIAANEMNLTDEQLQKLIDTYVSDYTNEHYTLLTSQYTLHSEQRMKAEKALIEARAGGIVMRYLPLDFNNIYEPAYYTEDFRKMITDRNPSKDFRYNLQEYLITEYGFTINQADRCLMEVVDLNKVTTKEFDMTLSDMIADPNAISKYSNLAQIFNDHFVEKFITIDGTNQLADIDLKVVYRPTDQSVKAQYSRLDSETNKPTITVFLKENTVLNNSQIDVLKHNIFHEVTHALADIQGLQNGTSTNYVKSALLETDDSTIQKLGKLLLTKSFYEENKTNKNILIDNIAYGIYRITDGEYAAESYKNSITRKDEYETNLKAGATMNRSGFRTDGNIIYGYGRFSGIELQAKTIVNQKAQYRLEALRQAYEVVSYQRVSDLRNHFAQKGITDFEKAGFSTEFVDALENDTLSVDSIWDMIDTNTIGSPEATKMMIEWLKPDNKHMTTMDAIEKAKALGIAYAAVYNVVQKNTNPDYDSSKSMSYSELTNFIEKNPKYFALVTKQMSSLANLLDQNKNSQINRWLIRNDYDYSGDSTTQLLSVLKGQYGINSKNETVSTTSSDGETSVIDLIEDTSQSPERQLIAEEEGLSEETSASDTVETVDDVIAGLKDNISKIGDSAELFKLRNTIENNKDILIKKYGEDGYKRILNAAPTAKSTYTKRINRQKKQLESRKDLTVKEQAIINQNTSDLTPSEYEAYIKRLEEIVNVEPKTDTPSVELNTSDSSEVKTSENVVKEKPVKEVLKETPKVKNTGMKPAKNITQEIKNATPSETVKPNKPSSITESILNLISNAATKDTTTQFIDPKSKEYKALSETMIREHLDVFVGITNDNYSVIRDELVKSGNTQALSLFDYATHEIADTFNSEVSSKIKDVWKARQTQAGQDLWLQSRRVADRKPINDFAEQLAKDGYRLDIDPKILEEYDSRLKEKDEYIQSLITRIEQLKEEIRNTENVVEQQELFTQLTKASEDVNVLKNGTSLDIIDWLINNAETLEQAQRIQKDFVEKMFYYISKAESDGKQIGFHLYDSKTGLPKSFPKTREFTVKWLKRLRSYRMWAMLSSPVTWVRNWMGNKAMQGMDSFTNVFERLFTRNTDFMEGQLKYQETKAGKDVYNHISETSGTYIEALIRGETSRYDETGGKAAEIARYERKLQYESANAFMKLCLKLQDGTDWGLGKGPLGDEPTLYSNICKNMGNLIASNTDYLLAGIQSEYDTLVKQTKHYVSGVLRSYKYKATITPGIKNGFNNSEISKITILNSKNEVILEYVNGEYTTKNKSVKDSIINEVVSKVTESGRQSIEVSKGRLDLLSKALETKNPNDIFDAISKEETKRLFKNSAERSYEQFFKNSNWLSKAFSNIASKNPVMAEIISWIMPFPKVAGNILKMAYRYSPLNFINGIMQLSTIRQMRAGDITGTGFEQAKMIRTFSEATVGTMMLIAGAIAAALGWIDIDDDDYLGPCLNFFGVRVSLSNLAPSMTVFSTASAMVWAWKNNKSAFAEALNVLYDNTLLGNVENLFRYSSLQTFASNLTISYLSQYIPSVLKLINNTLLQSPQKDKSGSYFTKLIKTLASYIPGLSSMVPDKVDPYTGEKVYSTGTDNYFLNFIFKLSPLDIKIDSKTELEKEAERLGSETSGLSGNFTINGEDIKVEGSEKEKLSKYRANYIQSKYYKILSGAEKVTVEDDDGKRITTTYDKLTDDQKSKVLQNLYSDATEKTKIKYWTDNGHYYVTSNIDSYNELKKLFGSGILYRTNWNKSKYMN